MAEAYYWYEGRRIALTPSTRKRAIRLLTPESLDVHTEITRLGATGGGLHLGGGILLFDSAVPIPTERIAVLATAPAEPLPVFDADNEATMIVTGEFVAQLKPTTTAAQFDDLNTKHGVSIVRSIPLDPKTYVLRVPSTVQTVATANAYQESGLVEFAHPNFMRVLKPAFVPNDTLFPTQWALRNTGQTGGIVGHDIHAVDSWDVSRGTQAITIAIIDEGVDYQHEDFAEPGKLARGYDAIRRIDDPTPNAADGHGTCCAGIAAAAGNNLRGISGVAPGCRLMGGAHRLCSKWTLGND